ncbi:MAG: hypothetical protein R3D68_08050 [Hyphomicrobiaceae bacterium]
MKLPLAISANPTLKGSRVFIPMIDCLCSMRASRPGNNQPSEKHGFFGRNRLFARLWLRQALDVAAGCVSGGFTRYFRLTACLFPVPISVSGGRTSASSFEGGSRPRGFNFSFFRDLHLGCAPSMDFAKPGQHLGMQFRHGANARIAIVV